MIQPCLPHDHNAKKPTRCPVCHDGRHEADDALHRHIEEAIAAIEAQNLSAENKLRQVMAILGRAQSTSQALLNTRCDQIRQIKPGQRSGNTELIPMAVFQINEAPDGLSEVSRAFHYVPDAPIYFRLQQFDALGRPVYKQV